MEYNVVYGVTLLGSIWVLSLAWLLVFSESLKDCVRGNGLGVVKVVVRCELGVNVKSFHIYAEFTADNHDPQQNSSDLRCI